MHLIDTHAHLDQEEFAADLDAVIDRAKAAGLDAIVAVGTTADSSAAAVALAGRYDCVWAAVGIQPNYCAQAAPHDWDRIVELAASPKVVAIGETGLDRHWDYTPFELQQDYFDRHIRLAVECGKPFVVHLRDCGPDIVAALRAARAKYAGPAGRLSGVMHSFTLDADVDPVAADFYDVADACLDLGLYISFAGMVTYKKKSNALRTIAARVPDDRIVVETDSPYLSPEPLRGRRNEPAHVIHTAARLAEVRGVTMELFAAQTTHNARTLFGIK